ncbi:putative reverse transcriptase domain-containing protein [Tanacetum coccineum]
MKDPDPVSLGLDLPPPLKGSISKPKRSMRSSISKPSVTIGLQKFRNVSNRMGKGNKVAGGVNEDESDGRESRDEGAGGEIMSCVFSDSQSFDSRSCKVESLVDGGNNSNATFSFNNVEKWPSLNRNCGIDVNGNNVGANKSGSNKLKIVSVCVNDQGKRVVDMDPLIEKGSKNWSMTLVGYFVGLKMSHREILGHLRRMYAACFGKWPLVGGWVAIIYTKIGSEDVISSMIGNPIIMDRITTEMCDRSYGRASFARVLIEVDADLGLTDKVKVWYKRLGKSMELRVEYPWKPPVYSHCKVFGHGLDRCLKRTPNDSEKKLNMGENA